MELAHHRKERTSPRIGGASKTGCSMKTAFLLSYLKAIMKEEKEQEKTKDCSDFWFSFFHFFLWLIFPFFYIFFESGSRGEGHVIFLICFSMFTPVPLHCTHPHLCLCTAHPPVPQHSCTTHPPVPVQLNGHKPCFW